jgi:hypothetical protein
MYVAYDDLCVKLTQLGCETVASLYSNQEEADTRMVLHAQEIASTGIHTIIVASSDTDVFVLFVAFVINCVVLLKHQQRTRTVYVDIASIQRSIGKLMCDALPALHAYTGCDTVSAFSGKGKVGAYKLVMANKSYQETFASLGTSWTVNNEKEQERRCKFKKRKLVPSISSYPVKVWKLANKVAVL